MNSDTALARARALTPAQKSAGAHLYNTIQWELNHIETVLAGESFMGAPSAAERSQLERERREYESAAAIVEEKQSGVNEKANEIFSRPRSLSARAQRTMDHDDQDQDETHKPEDHKPEGGGTATVTRPNKARTAGPGPRARQRLAVSRARRMRARGPARQAKTVAYQVDNATGNWGSVAAMFLIGGVLLSILLLTLRNAGGVAKLETGVTTVIDWILSPVVDPLRPPGSNTIGAPRTPINSPGRPTPAGGFRP